MQDLLLRSAFAISATCFVTGCSDHAAGVPVQSITYDCSVVQIRNAGCSCGDAQPPGSLSGPGASSAFTMTVDGGMVDVPASFSCSGASDGGNFSCTIVGCPFGGCSACSQSCPGTIWEISPQDPANRPLDAGEIYAGIPANNSFSAHCRPH